jgi:glycosyltransferase involved in cell wall biosynthesis
LIVSQYFHPENFQVNQLARALSQQGHELVVLTGQPNYPTGRFFQGYHFARPLTEQFGSIRIVRVPLFRRGRGRAWSLALNYLSFVVFAILFGLPRVRGPYDVCIAWCPSPITSAIPAILLRRWRKIPAALWLQDLWPETFFGVTKSRSRIVRKVLSRMVRWIYANMDQVWIQSPGYMESVRAHGGRLEQVRYMPNWAEDLYDSARWSDVASDQIPANSLVFAGNLGRAQDLETLIAAAEMTHRSVPLAHWVFVGDGTMRDWLAAEVQRRSLGAHVTILPRRPPQQMPNILKPAAALLITLGDEEVFAQTIPSKVQSSLAAGRPVIGALSGESARLIAEARCGLICPPRQPLALAETIKQFFALPASERDALGRHGHEFYQAHFTQDHVIAQVTEALRAMVAARAGKATS